jgi:hypothetical protein
VRLIFMGSLSGLEDLVVIPEFEDGFLGFGL